MNSKKDESIWIETMVSHRTHEPLVVLRWYDHSGELTPQQAREHALAILAAADAAESDAFIVDFLCNRVKVPIEKAGMMLKEFRRYRDERSDDDAEDAA